MTQDGHFGPSDDRFWTPEAQAARIERAEAARAKNAPLIAERHAAIEAREAERQAARDAYCAALDEETQLRILARQEKDARLAAVVGDVDLSSIPDWAVEQYGALFWKRHFRMKEMQDEGAPLREIGCAFEISGAAVSAAFKKAERRLSRIALWHDRLAIAERTAVKHLGVPAAEIPAQWVPWFTHLGLLEVRALTRNSFVFAPFYLNGVGYNFAYQLGTVGPSQVKKQMRNIGEKSIMELAAALAALGAPLGCLPQELHENIVARHPEVRFMAAS